MPFPWPSFGSYLFRKTEQPVWGTDVGWVNSPTTSRNRPVGSTSDVITAISIGSAERTFELWMSVTRYENLRGLMNTRALFTDWLRPIPNSRNAYLADVIPVSDGFSYDPFEDRTVRKKLVRVTLITST